MDNQIGSNLDQREWNFLIKIVLEYIKLAEPISSRHLSKLDDVNLSSATIRHTMLNLSEKGYLEQPHTSSGRIPSDLAYRIYVDHLESSMTFDNSGEFRKIEILQDDLNSEELLAECLNLLADSTKYTSLATKPDPKCLKLKSIEFFKITGNRVLTLLITDSGVVKTKIFSPREDLPVPFLKELGEELTTLYVDRPISELQKKVLDTLAKKKIWVDDRLFAQAVRLSKKALELDETDPVIICGKTYITEWLEIYSAEEANKIYQEMEGRKELIKILNTSKNDSINKVKFRIGNEMQVDNLHNCALVMADYGVNQEKVGTIGVLGPKRMDYEKIAGLVKNLAHFVSVTFGDNIDHKIK